MLSDPFFLFLHIPKAAGTTLRSIVDLQLGAENILTYYNQPSRQLLDNLPYMTTDPSFSKKALMGHFGFGVHRNLGRPAPYITFFRDPVQLGISAYFENLKTYPDRLQNADGNVCTLEEFIEIDPAFFANQQTKHILGTDDLSGSPDDILKSAVAVLNGHFLFVGTVEQFDSSILLLSKIMNWRPCTYGKLNQGSSGSEIGPEILERLENLNFIDRTLHNWAKLQLAARTAAHGEAYTKAQTSHLSQLSGPDAPADFAKGSAELVQFLDATHSVI